jgi:ribosomal RNA assembly protein
MKIIICEKIARIIKNKKKLEKLLEIKITNRGKEVTIAGNPEEEYDAIQVIDALNQGFPYTEAISIKTEDKILKIVNIKDHTKKSNLERIRGRIIGKGGKALKTLSNLTDSAMELKENHVSIIAEPENMERAVEALIAIIKGAKHGATYKELEKNMPKPIYDLGLKDKEKFPKKE